MQIVPRAGDLAAPSPAPQHFHWRYELRPAQELPVVDLSVSLRSRVLNQRWLARATSCTRRGRLILGLFMPGAALFTCVFFVPYANVTRVLGLLATALILPSTIAGLSVLRYDMVRLLLRTYDIWFLGICSLSCFIVLGIQFSDVRAAVAFTVWSAMHINILVDANLRGAKRMAVMNIGVATGMSLSLCAIKLKLVADLHSFVVLCHGPHKLLAEDFVTSTAMTIIAMVLRNIVRSRETLRRQGGIQQVRCVSYRTMLRLVKIGRGGATFPSARTTGSTTSITRAATVTSTASTAPPSVVSAASTQPSPIQRLQYMPKIDVVDARRTIVPLLTIRLSRFSAAQQLMRMVGLGAFVTSVVAGFLTDYTVTTTTTTTATTVFTTATHDSMAMPIAIPVLQLIALLWTVAFLSLCGSCYHRELLHALLSSFDFAYLSSQLTLIHATTCDFFQWSLAPCLVVLTSWLWIHWVLGVDALSPLVKNALRVHSRFPAVVLSTGIVASGMLLYRIIAVDTSPVVYERVLWSATVFGEHVAVRLMPLFYDCTATVLAWTMRLLYRAWTFDSDMLILLDGPVGYTNYMSRPRNLGQHRPRIQSRQWKTFPTLEVGPSVARTPIQS